MTGGFRFTPSGAEAMHLRLYLYDIATLSISISRGVWGLYNRLVLEGEKARGPVGAFSRIPAASARSITPTVADPVSEIDPDHRFKIQSTAMYVACTSLKEAMDVILSTCNTWHTPLPTFGEWFAIHKPWVSATYGTIESLQISSIRRGHSGREVRGIVAAM